MSVGLCPACRRVYGLVEGRWVMRVHKVSGSRRVTCAGSGRPPLEVMG